MLSRKSVSFVDLNLPDVRLPSLETKMVRPSWFSFKPSCSCSFRCFFPINQSVLSVSQSLSTEKQLIHPHQRSNVLLQLPVLLTYSSISHYPLKQLIHPHQRSNVLLQLPVLLTYSSISHYPLKQLIHPHQRSNVLSQLLVLLTYSSISHYPLKQLTHPHRRSRVLLQLSVLLPYHSLSINQSLSTKTGDSSTSEEQSALAASGASSLSINQSMSINQCSTLRWRILYQSLSSSTAGEKGRRSGKENEKMVQGLHVLVSRKLAPVSPSASPRHPAYQVRWGSYRREKNCYRTVKVSIFCFYGF